MCGICLMSQFTARFYYFPSSLWTDLVVNTKRDPCWLSRKHNFLPLEGHSGTPVFTHLVHNSSRPMDISWKNKRGLLTNQLQIPPGAAPCWGWGLCRARPAVFHRTPLLWYVSHVRPCLPLPHQRLRVWRRKHISRPAWRKALPSTTKTGRQHLPGE